MKKITLLLSLLICNLSLSSCYDETETAPDTSLAGSVVMAGYQFEADGRYDGIDLTNFKREHSSLTVDKLSDTEIDLSCNSRWGNTRINIYIPTIQLYGNPYDVSFDSTSENATIKYDNNKTNCAIVNIKGWIKKIDTLKPDSNNLSTKDADPATPNYSCEIIITSDINNISLEIKIHSVIFRF